jgi:hypothetical protein
MQRAGTPQYQEHDRRYRQRWLLSNPSLNQVNHVAVPENVERREESAPCKLCGLARGCKHRPWMLRA